MDAPSKNRVCHMFQSLSVGAQEVHGTAIRIKLSRKNKNCTSTMSNSDFSLHFGKSRIFTSIEDKNSVVITCRKDTEVKHPSLT